MNNCLILSFIAAFISSVVSAEPMPEKTKSLTPEQIKERKEAAKRRMYERTGGYVIQPSTDARVLALVNVNNTMDMATLTSVAKMMTEGAFVPAIVSTERPANAGFILEIKDTDYPATILTAPENGYAMLNVRGLKKDSPDEAKLKTRLIKQVWRTMMLALGSGYDLQPKCLMKPVASLADLDALESTCPCPQTFSAVSMGAERYGIKPERRTTYRVACQEGWAPQPTNDVQKAIWDKVHAMPTAPIQIKPETKKVEK